MENFLLITVTIYEIKTSLNTYLLSFIYCCSDFFVIIVYGVVDV